MKGIILAAGLGTRLKPITNTIPKCMIEIADKPVIEWQLEYLSKFGINQVVVNLHYLPSKFMEYLGTRVFFLYEPELLGEMGTINKLKDWIDQPTVVLNGDTLTDLNIYELSCYTNVNLVRSMNGEIYTGQMVIRPSYFEKPRITEVQTHCYWQDIGTPEGLKKARDYYQNIR